MTDTRTIAADFTDWARGFDTRGQALHNELTYRWANRIAIRGSRTVSRLENELEQHTLPRFADPLAFWNGYLSFVDQTFPVRPGFQEQTKKFDDFCRALAQDNHYQRNGSKTRFYEAWSHACEQKTSALWARGYSAWRPDATNPREYVRITDALVPTRR